MTTSKEAYLYVRVDADLKEHLKAYAASHDTSMRVVVESAVRQFLDPEDYKTVALNYLAKLERDDRLLQKRVELLLETLGKFVLIYLMHTPELPEDEALRRASARSARARYDKFVDALAKSLDGSNAFRRVFEERVASADDFLGD